MADQPTDIKTKVGKEISTPDLAGRTDAYNKLHDAATQASPAELKQIAADVTSHIDMKSLGLEGFHLDSAAPTKLIKVDKADAPDHKDHNLPAFQFTSADGKQSVIMLAGGSEFDPKTGALKRDSDIKVDAPAAPAGAAPSDAPAPATPAPKPGDAPAAAPAPTDAPAPAAPARPGDAPADPDRAKVQQLIQKQVDDAALSDPVKRGEGYYQVLKRMHPDMSPEDAVKQARHMRDMNNGNTNLKVGDRLPLMTDDEKKAAVQQALAAFDKLPADQKAAAIAQAKTAFPDAPAPAAPAPGDAPAAPAAPAAAAPGDAPAPAAPAAKPPAGDAPAAPAAAPPAGDAPAAPAAAPPAGDAPAAPAAAPPAGDAPAAPAAAPPAGDAPAAPAAAATAPDAGSTWKPTLDVKGNALDPKGDPTKPETLIYNPLAPMGLTAGGAGSDLSKATAGVDNRQVTGTSEKGQLDNRDWAHWFETNFTTTDSMQDGKLAGRITTYDSSRVNMKFQTPNNGDPVQIEGVSKVQTVLDAKNHSYTTTVTDSNNKTYSFVSDEKGVVIGYQAN